MFCKPDVIVVADQLEASEPSTFEFLLHAPTSFSIDGDRLRLESEDAACVARIMSAHDLTISTTDQFDPPPRERIQLIQYHLTAATPAVETAQFYTVIRPHRVGDPAPPLGDIEYNDRGAAISIPYGGDTLEIDLTFDGAWACNVAVRP